VSLADARAKCEEARKLIFAGKDSSVEKKLTRLAAQTAARNTVRLVAEEYVANLEATGAAPITVARTATSSWRCSPTGRSSSATPSEA
jgi:hypothetical protein